MIRFLVFINRVLRQLDPEAELASQADQSWWQEITLNDDISAGNSEVDAHAFDARKAAEPKKFTLVGLQERRRLLHLTWELVKTGLTDHDVDP